MASSKRKAGVNSGGPSTKKITGSLAAAALAQGQVATDTLNGYPRKSNKSNNRREWMKECLKLLEAMIERPDAKPFREPVDCVKYPDFYAQVEDPIDFSKVMLKFRGGQYQDPFDFEKDVSQLFKDYKGFFKDPNSEVYGQTRSLCCWFEAEFRRILEKYGDKLKKRQESMSPLAAYGDPTARTSPKQSPERNSVPALLTDHSVPMHHLPWHQSMGTKNYQVVQQIMGPLTSSSVSPNNSLHPPFSHALPPGANKELYHMPGAGGNPSAPWLDPHLRDKCLERPMYCAAEKRAGFASRMHNTSFEMMNGGELQVAMPNLYTRSLDRDPRMGTNEERPRPYPPSAAAGSGGGGGGGGGGGAGGGGLQQFKSASFDVPYQHHHSPSSSSHEYDRASHHSASLSPKPHTPTRTPTRTPTPTLRVPSPARQTPPIRSTVSIVTEKPADQSGSVATLVGMKLDVCNVWLGSVRGKTTKPIILHEHGLKIPFYYRDTETNLHIKVEEIVRCLGHLGKNKKHTILVFVTPTCVQRIERRVRVRDTGTSLIALFLSALSVGNISRLLHTFHNMGKHSMFGQSLFSEVDQRGILKLLANIKPDINERLKNSKLSGGSTDSKDSDVRTVATLTVPDMASIGRSRSLPVTSDPPAPSSNPEQGALDLSVARSNGMFHSASMDSPTPTKAKHTTKAYKPKFHFRSNSHLVRQHSTTTEPHFDSGMGSSSEDSGSVPRPPLQKNTSAESSGESNESMTGSDIKKEDLDPESDLDLDYDEEEAVGESSHSVLLVVDSNDEELATIHPDEEEMEDENIAVPFRPELRERQMSESSESPQPPLRQGLLVPHGVIHVFRNPYCGHSYERDDLLHLLQQRDLKARCPAPGCSNDHPLKLTEMMQSFEAAKPYDRDSSVR